MLFWIWVIMLVAGIATFWFYEKKYEGYNSTLGTISDLLIAFGLLGTLVAGAFAIGGAVNVEGKYATRLAEYESLVYQYENNMYDNDNDLGKKELMDDIQLWNETVASKRHGQNNFWIGIFIPDIWDNLEFIELK